MIPVREFYTMMRVLDKAYPRFTLDEETTEVYYQVLGDIDPHLLKCAILDYISRDTPWCPSAGQLRTAAFELVETGSDALSSGEAWGEVLAQVRAVGYCGMPAFSSETITEAVQAVGGWRYICSTPENVIHTTRARFASAYDVLQKRQRDNVRMLPQVRDVVLALTAPPRPAIEAGIDRKGE